MTPILPQDIRPEDIQITNASLAPPVRRVNIRHVPTGVNTPIFSDNSFLLAHEQAIEKLRELLAALP